MVAREKWSNRFDFLFITVGSAVGLGNVWRFPYLCYKNGGGAFLIPYFLGLFLMGLPQLILETSLGQFTSRSATKSWSIVPVMRGLGYAVVIYNSVSNITYATVLSWGLQYLYASFSQVLPWMTCGNSWNTENCFVPTGNGSSLYNFTSLELINGTATNNGTPIVSSVTEYWERSVLGISTGLTDVGSFQSRGVICLLLTWMISFLCMFRGVNWTSKVTYVTAPLPIILLFVILIRGLTLDGARDGILYFISPDLGKLLQPQVWKDAVLQNIFSLSVGSGTMIAFGSFNKYHHNFYRDCFVLSCVNSGASILSGFAVFSTLGFMAKQQNTTVDQVAESGPGLAFVAYPQALSMMPGSQFWSAIFFIMFVLLGLDTLFVSIEGIVAAISDLAPSTFDKRWKKTMLNFMISMSLCLAGLITVTKSGIYYIYLFDNFASTSWALLFGIACATVAISWMYGLDKYYENIQNMLQYRPIFPWFLYCWKFITPVVSMVLFVYSLVLYKPLVYNRTYVYPPWSIGFGWLLSLSGFVWIPGYAIYYTVKTKCFKVQDRTAQIDLMDKKIVEEEHEVMNVDSF